MHKDVSEEITFGPEVKFSLEGKKLSVKGPKGEASRVFDFDWLELKAENGKLKLSASNAVKKTFASFNAILSHVRNMESGVKKGFIYKLAIVYSHFPINLSIKGDVIEVNNFLGGKNPRRARIRGSTKVEVKGKDVIVSGVDKEAVGQTAANLERCTARKKGKDIRVFQDGIYIVEKGARNA